MPSPDSILLVTAPVDGSYQDQLDDLNAVLHGATVTKTPAGHKTYSNADAGTKLGKAQGFKFPEFKIKAKSAGDEDQKEKKLTGTLSSLLTLSESMAKYDVQLTGTLSKVVDTIRSITTASASGSTAQLPADRVSPLASHLVMDDGRPYLEYVFNEQTGWEWNRGKYRTDSRTLTEIVDGLVKEAHGIENAQRVKSGAYSLTRGQLAVAARRQNGNLSVRSMAEVVSAGDFAATNNSEYLETVLVAVPNNLAKEWTNKYERLSTMVVPRSSAKLASDDEFTLFSATIFRKVHDEFVQKCRENRYIVRDFTYDSEAIEKGKVDLVALEVNEKELWSDLLRLSRINFSEALQVLVHLKVVRAFVESVLRYGLPADYFASFIKPEHKQMPRVLSVLSEHLSENISPSARKVKKVGKASNDDEVTGEFATILEGEYYDFVNFEIEKVEEVVSL